MKWKDIGVYFLNNIEWFKKYYYAKDYDDEELEMPFIVIWVLNSFIKEKYLDKEYRIVWNKKEFLDILKIMNYFLDSKEDILVEIVLIWFLEWISQNITSNIYSKNLRKILFYPKLQQWLDKINLFWWTNKK
jgi:hypothetical protein